MIPRGRHRNRPEPPSDDPSRPRQRHAGSRHRDLRRCARAQGNEEVTAFQDVGLIESLLLTGNFAAATRRAVRLIDVVDRFGDDHLLPTTVRRLLAVAADAAGNRSACEQWLHEARTHADLHRIKPEQAAVAAIDARRATHDRAPDEQHRADVSSRLDEVLGVLSRPLFPHGRERRAVISGTEFRPGRRRSLARRSPQWGTEASTVPRVWVPRSVTVWKLKPLPATGSTHTVVALRTIPFGNWQRASTSAIMLAEL